MGAQHCRMKTIAAASFYFEGQTENAYAAADNSNLLPVVLIVINFRANKRNIDESLIKMLWPDCEHW